MRHYQELRNLLRMSKDRRCRLLAHTQHAGSVLLATPHSPRSHPDR